MRNSMAIVFSFSRMASSPSWLSQRAASRGRGWPASAASGPPLPLRAASARRCAGRRRRRIQRTCRRAGPFV
eukprot:3731057-Pyramimonas_sp.AAC.1